MRSEDFILVPSVVFFLLGLYLAVMVIYVVDDLGMQRLLSDVALLLFFVGIALGLFWAVFWRLSRKLGKEVQKRVRITSLARARSQPTISKTSGGVVVFASKRIPSNPSKNPAKTS